MKAVIHVDESKKWDLALTNAENIMRYGEQTGTDFNIEIVANSEAVKDLREDEAREAGRYDTVRDLALDTVKFTACRNALASAGIRESTLIPFVEVVPSGAVELIKKQHEGFAYIKP
ncbi:DsrE family protein [Christensenella tenuis]|nr:DsrE family protein [Christensenella tenuis]